MELRQKSAVVYRLRQAPYFLLFYFESEHKPSPGNEN